jgi:hypothetical protein
MSSVFWSGTCFTSVYQVWHLFFHLLHLLDDRARQNMGILISITEASVYLIVECNKMVFQEKLLRKTAEAASV